jgi:hypothetical protein
MMFFGSVWSYIERECPIARSEGLTRTRPLSNSLPYRLAGVAKHGWLWRPKGNVSLRQPPMRPLNFECDGQAKSSGGVAVRRSPWRDGLHRARHHALAPPRKLQPQCGSGTIGTEGITSSAAGYLIRWLIVS